jgi:hypothetical protein
MKGIRELLKDRRRSQRGSVLSGVLIMTAFIAIISGALMTELSTNFLLSTTMVKRVTNEATVNSAIELALSRLQTAPLNAPCPALSTAAVNNLTASATYLTCWPTVREAQRFVPVAASAAPFNVDGTHAQANGDYVVADAGGTVFDFPFGWSAPRWQLPLGGQVTATPVVIPMPGSSKVLDVIPLAGPGCSSASYCLNVRLDDNSLNSPAAWCFVATTGGSVVSQPSASPTQPGLVYYGDGTLLEATDVSVPGSGCDPESTVTVPGTQPVVAGPIAFACASGCGNVVEEIYAVVSDGSSSRLLRYTYGKSSLGYVTNLSLPWANVSGIAVSAATLPASVAISFRGGGVALVQINLSGGMTLLGTAPVPAIVADAPYWCHCPGGDLIGLGAQDGGLYLYNTALVPQPGFPAGGALISTTPGVDAAGNWYFGAADGYVHEVQLQPGQTSMTQVESYGPVGQVTSSVQVAGCPQGICIYLGTLNNHAYLVPLDARKAVISACITTSPPTCSGANPRLWASVEVGAKAGPQTVHVQGWSYYSG